MKYSFDVKISEHIWEDSLGQLVCLNAIIAREGYQEYYEDDILKNNSFKIVKVLRPWEEVLKSAPTFEAKPIIIQHPDKSIDISVKNIKDYKVGHVQNVREGEHEGIKVLIADLVFDDSKAIEKVKSGELRELSCGYFYEIDPKEMKQYDIKGEHLALVEEGRAGIAKIIDAKEEIFELNKYLKLPSKEEKDKFMSKISTEVLNGIKAYYNKNEEEVFSPEEIEMTIKIVDRELNNRNNKDMGLSEEARKEKLDSDGIKAQDDLLPGGLADGLTIRELCLKHDTTERFIRRQLQRGMTVELEHTDDELKAREIAMDHLYENPNYYEKLSKMEKDTKGQDLYVEDDDKISLTFDEDEIAWASISVGEVNKGDIVSTLNSIRPFEVQSIKEEGRDFTLYLISTDENYRKTLEMSEDDILDVLVLVKTGKRVRFDSFKAKDSGLKVKISELIPGDTIEINGKNIKITDIDEHNGLYDIYHESNVVFMGANGDLEVNKK